MGEKKASRNYQIDVLKLFLSLLVFVNHSRVFIGSNTGIRIPDTLGWISVHFFFMISGFLLIKSLYSKNINAPEAGVFSFNYVLNKFKRIALSYWTATAIFIALRCIVTVYQHNALDISDIIIKAIPELFAVNNAGVRLEYNSPTWYISAMLPLSYLMIRNKNFFVYVFSPTAALFTLGYMYQQCDSHFIDRSTWCGFILASIIRAVCGISFGGIVYIIYEKLIALQDTKENLLLMTVTELLLNIIFFGTWFFSKNNETLYSAQLLIPVMIAIAFSEKSYITRLFKAKWLRYSGSLSLSIYFNHWAARYIVIKVFGSMSYKESVIYMALFTAALCILNSLTVKLIKFLWDKKHKSSDTIYY